jgi:hypothetical protein
MSRTLFSKIVASESLELLVNEWSETLERRLVATTPLDEELADFFL